MAEIRSQAVGLFLAVLLLAASPGAGEDWNALEWSKAADRLGSTVWASALREEAYRSYPENDAAVSAVLAGWWLRQQLANGLAANAVATFRSLPPAVRTRLEEGPSGKTVSGEIGGQTFREHIPDLRLELAAAHLLVGDSRGAVALADKVPSPPPAPSRPWLSRLESGPAEYENVRLFKSIIALWLHPASEDPFELLATAAGREHGLGLIFQILLGRLAEREGYPALAEHSLGSVASRMGDWATGESTLSNPIPAHVVAAGRRLEADLASVRRSLEEQVRAASAKVSHDSEAAVRARAAFRELIDPRDRRNIFSAEPIIELFMIDRAGKRAFGIWYEGPPAGPMGGQFRLEESGGVWKSERIGSWIS